MTKKQNPKCPACLMPQAKRGICDTCKADLKIAQSLRSMGIEVRSRDQTLCDVMGFPVAWIIFDPMVKFTNFKAAENPVAVCVNSRWYFRLDENNPMNLHLENEWKEKSK